MNRMNTDNTIKRFGASFSGGANFIRPCLRSSVLSVSSVLQGVAAALFTTGCTLAHAEVTVKDAWVRGTVPAQTTTGAFMTITSTSEAKLVGAASPVAKMVEIHESSMHGNMAHMQEVSAVSLPAGKAVQLKPGGHHVMLMGVGKPLKPGDTVPLTLTIEEKGKRSTLEVRAAVRPIGSQ
jgi:hypothetical protein